MTPEQHATAKAAAQTITRSEAGDQSKRDWCYDDDWQDTDPTSLGAAARFVWYERHGMPKNGLEQCLGEVPLSYTTTGRAPEGVGDLLPWIREALG